MSDAIRQTAQDPGDEPLSEHAEIEAKYVVPDASTFERLMSLEALGEYGLVPRGELRLTDHYLDTAQRDLLHGHYACRRRASGGSGQEVVAVKGLGGAHEAVHRRIELEAPIPPGAMPARWPAGPARDIVLRLAGERRLVELFTVNQRRTLRDVEHRGRRVAVLSLDRIEFGAREATAYELEIELSAAGDGADLQALGSRLLPFGLRPQTLSKFERALALLDADSALPEPGRGAAPELRAEPEPRGEPEPSAESRAEPEPRAEPEASAESRAARPRRAAKPERRARATSKRRTRTRAAIGISPDDSMAEAGRKILGHYATQMLAHESGTIAGEDPEELHDMRVATRRQRAALRIVAPHFRGKAIRPLRNGLRELGGRLGAVRDLDVLLAAAREYQAKLGATEARAFQGLIDAWARKDDDDRRRMLEHLSGPDYAEFKKIYARFLETPGAGARAPASDESPRPTRVAHVLPPEIWEHFGAVCAYESVLPAAPVGTLHALRIEGKRLRYVLEFFREVLDPCAEEAIEAIVALQDHLGELQDGVVAMGLVREFLSGPEAVATPGAPAAAGRYLEARQLRIDELRRSLERPWQRVIGLKRCLTRALAPL